MRICWSRARSFRSRSRSRPSAVLTSANASTQTSWQKSLTAREESLFRRRCAQLSVTIEMRREPALQTFGVEYRAMIRIVVTHREQRFDETLLLFGIEIGPRRKHAMVVRWRRPNLTKRALGHQSLFAYSFP